MFPRSDKTRFADILKDIENRDRIDNIALWINFYKMMYGPDGIGSVAVKN